MSNPTQSQAQRSFFVFVKDKDTGKIRRMAIPSNTQIGLVGNPASLTLFGGLNLSTREFATAASTSLLAMNNEDTILAINGTIAPSTINVSLPPGPQTGQVHFIKDASSTAATSNIVITPAAGKTIDGATSLTISDNDGSAMIGWIGSAWHVLVSGGGGGGGGGAPTNAKYVTLATDATLSQERVLTAGTALTLVDGGAGSTATINLDATAVTPGSYTTANITVDAQGRLTAASNGLTGLTMRMPIRNASSGRKNIVGVESAPGWTVIHEFEYFAADHNAGGGSLERRLTATSRASTVDLATDVRLWDVDASAQVTSAFLTWIKGSITGSQLETADLTTSLTTSSLIQIQAQCVSGSLITDYSDVQAALEGIFGPY